MPDVPSPAEPRRVVLDGVHNMRDLGGLPTGDGHRVKPGVLFRSDQFNAAGPADMERLAALGLRTIIDLRTPGEVELHGRLELDGADYRNIELKHLRWELFPHNELSEDLPFLPHRYTAMAETGAEAVRDALGLIATSTPVLVHCIAGKDRTGLVTAVTLALVGVADHDIAADYELSVQGQRRYREWCEANGRKAFVGKSSPAEAMSRTLAELRARFVSIEGYARVIGFTDVDKLRENLLEPA